MKTSMEAGGVALLLVALAACEETVPPRPVPMTAPEPLHSCADWVFDHPDSGPGPDGAVISDRFYWGSRRGAATCSPPPTLRSNSMVGQVESVAGGKATEATVLRVKEAGRVTAVWLILHLSDGRYCTGSLDGDRAGGASCVLNVVPAGETFSVRELPAVPPRAPAGDAPGGGDTPEEPEPIAPGATGDAPEEPGGEPDEHVCPVGHVYNFDLNTCCRDGSCTTDTAPEEGDPTGEAPPEPEPQVKDAAGVLRRDMQVV